MHHKQLELEDKINSPIHYNHTGTEAIDGIRAMLGEDGFEAYCAGNILKYLWRRNYKDNYEDNIKKIIWYANKLLEGYYD